MYDVDEDEANFEGGPPVEVPYAALDPELLKAVVQSFVLREGTDYGEREVSLDDKVLHVLRQLERREARLMFDPETRSVSIIRS